MIVNCPKCGFTQPQDRYCANCGVDMSLYRKAEIPLGQRILKNWVFQTTLLLLALFAIFFGLRLQQKFSNHDADSQFSDVRTAQVTATQAELPPDVPKATPLSTPIALEAAAPVATVAAIPSPTPVAAAATAVSTVSVTYTEMPRPSFNDLAIDARGVTNEGSLVTGVILDADKRLKSARNTITLDSQAPQGARVGQPLAFYRGLRDPATGANLGFNIQITPQANDDQGLHMLVDIQRVLRENGGPAPAEQNFQFEFVLPKGAAGFVSGLLPRRPLDDVEHALYRGSPVLNVMASPEYVQAQSEFVIFFQAH